MPVLTIQEIPIPSDTPTLEGQIRCRAYKLYEERGRRDGHQLEDWLRAEAEIMAGEQEPQP